MEGRREIAELISDHLRYSGEVAAALDKTIVTLSGAALVFSMTFADRLAPARLWLPILFLSWLAFTIALLSVIFGLRTLQNSMYKKADELNQMSDQFEKHLAEGKVGSVILSITRERKVAVWNSFGIWSFVSAILFLGVFVGRNLLASH